MTPFTGLVLYLLIWWTALFAVLPLGVHPHDDVTTGTAGSAPEQSGLKKKFGLTTLIAALVWLAVYGAIQAGLLDFREMAQQMAQADRASGQIHGDGIEKPDKIEKTGESAPP